jgi:hypothetical protein
VRILTATCGERTGRIFTVRPESVDESLRAHFETTYFEADSLARSSLLRAAFPTCSRVTAHPTECDSEIYALYLDTPVPLFCCMVATRAWLDKAVRDDGDVFEIADMQVADGTLTEALLAWATRNFPGVPLPDFEVRVYEEPSV